MGSSEERRKLHAVSWESLCKPKEQGGIGLRRLREMNEALLGKIGWNVIVNPNNLCSKVLTAKYRRNVDLKRSA